MRIKLRSLAVIALAAGFTAACENQLEVKNLNSPDLRRVYNSPTGIEGVVSTLFRTYHNTSQSGEGLNSQSKAFALESYGQVANFGMALRGGIPRIFINNQRGNQVTVGNNNHWNGFSRLMRTAAVAVQSTDAFIAGGGTLGSPEANARARAFGFFVNALAMGNLALGYDSVAVATPQTPGSAIPALISYAAAMDTAVRMLDSAQAIAATAAGIPGTWIGSATEMSQANFIRLIRTYKARFRANVFRTPDEATAAGAAYWTLVRDDALNGITTDLVISLSGSTNWTSALDAGTFNTSSSWHQVSLVYAGVADTSGAYQTNFGTGTTLGSRNGMAVLVQTPDRRWPTGADRAQQSADTLANGSPALTGQYLINRNSGGDQPDLANPWGTSQYDHRRWLHVAKNSQTGNYVYRPAAETRLIEAEARWRLGDQTGANALVNALRTANNLTALDAAGNVPVAGNCVPRMRDGTCGTFIDALAYEKRMETMLTGYMQWYTDSRRWGDLPAGTALHWPVPNQEMDTRNQAFYNMPATGTMAGAAGSTKYGV